MMPYLTSTYGFMTYDYHSRPDSDILDGQPLAWHTILKIAKPERVMSVQL